MYYIRQIKSDIDDMYCYNDYDYATYGGTLGLARTLKENRGSTLTLEERATGSFGVGGCTATWRFWLSEGGKNIGYTNSR